ncbi:hypothetical protein [Streptomyces oceani]|uniref:Peptidoglycan binding domain-containing protein n=1 Tax=Streptomyces oceani TaxID=1075402 RepID=A0A1E7JJ53_9ACTN|nr:hypothetical protein [Streptomyces oceani]OEU87652.1 hypothetical protein AN216_25960 [Streptomyces oceani]
MSRETDSSSSGPRGRGGSAYDPGTEPYGSAEGADEPPPGSGPDSGGETDEPKTETTLTTRIRINIPGSRPIPPVVMRKPVGEKGGPEEDGTTGEAGAISDTSDASATPAPSSAAASASTSASASGSARGGADGTVAMSADGAGDTRGSRGQGGPRERGGSGARSKSGGGSASGDGEFSQGTSDWFAPRKRPKRDQERAADSAGSPAPRAPGDDPAGGSPYGTGPAGGSPYGASPGDPAGGPATGPESGSGHPDTPPDGFPSVGTGLGTGAAEDTGSMPSPVDDLMGPFQGGPSGAGAPSSTPPSGPTSGPETGDMPLGSPATGTPPLPPFGSGPPVPGEPPEPPVSALYESGGIQVPPPPPPVPGGGPDLGGAKPATGPDDPERSSETLVSGIPRLPSSEGERPGGGLGTAPGRGPAGEPPAPPPADSGLRQSMDDSAEPPASKGRSKLVMVGLSLVGVLGLAYGVGLFLDHADVPKGTTVLNVEIGGKQQQDAVDTLDKELGDRVTAPLTVEVGGEKTKLKPSVAGLTIDTEETVRDASGRDYNPVSVIGSLLGGSRDAEAVLEVDDDKLKEALSSLPAAKDGAGETGEGMVKFVNGEAVGVPGKPHKGIDVDKAADTVTDAYRERAATGADSAVRLPVSTQQPKISKREIQQAVNGFGEKAMSGWVWLKAGDVEVPFSEETIGDFLTMREGGGTLQPVVDRAALEKTYGSAFDEVVIDGAAGTVPMTSKHAAIAMTQALGKTAPESGKRLAVVANARSR